MTLRSSKAELTPYDPEIERTVRGIEKAKEQNVYKGRGQIKIDPLLFDRVANDYLHGKISADQASLILKISRATFFRRLRERK